MALIRKQNEIDVYANVEEKFVTISEVDGYFDEHNGNYKDTFIVIDVAHIDAVISALQNAKKEILEG